MVVEDHLFGFGEPALGVARSGLWTQGTSDGLNCHGAHAHRH